MVEDTFGANLGGNFPVVDHWDPYEKYVVSVRSHALTASGAWESAVLDDIAELKGGIREPLSGFPAGSRQRLTIDPSEIRNAYLVQVVTEGELASQDTSRALAAIRSQAGSIRVILTTMKNWRK